MRLKTNRWVVLGQLPTGKNSSPLIKTIKAQHMNCPSVPQLTLPSGYAKFDVEGTITHREIVELIQFPVRIENGTASINKMSARIL